MSGKRICNHPELVPTRWNQPKPEPAEMATCKCGRNAQCLVCGWGWGTYPCDCRPAPKHRFTLSSALQAEFDAWETTSNEALIEFEEGLV